MTARLALIVVASCLTVPCFAAPPAPAGTVPKPSPASTASAVYPTKISAKYAKESAGKARMHTCLDQYKANKTANANGGQTWIQKGGGYYSTCSKRLGGG